MSGISTKNLPLSQSVDELVGNDSQDNTVRIARQALVRLVGDGIAEQITNAGGMAIFANTSAGLAATTDGDYFSVPSPDNDEYLILYRNDNGSAEEVKRYPSTAALETLRDPIPTALDWNVIDRSGFYSGSSTGGETSGSPDDDRAHLRLLHIQGSGGRGSQLAFDNSATVQRAWLRTSSGGGWSDWGEIALQSAVESAIAEAEDEYQVMWSQMGHTAELTPFPPMQIGSRFVHLDTVSFDLVPLSGTWVDTGLPWLPGGEWDDLFPLTRLEVDDEEVIVTEWSFDLRPLRGYVATTGELWPAIGGGSAVSNPPMEVVFGTDQINVYIRQHGPTYVQWRIAHDVVPERNADIWRISKVYEATRTPAGYNQGQEICFDGEHEVAIRLKKSSGGNKPDHIGGNAHGNEELTDFYVLLDGVEVDHTAPGRHACSRFEMVQASDMFEPGDTEETVWDPKGPKIMECYKHWLFTPHEGLRLAQRVNHIVGGFEVDNGYFGMLCLGWGSRGYDSVHTGAREPYWSRVDLGPGFVETLDSANHIRAWGDRYSGEVRVTRGWDSPGRNIHIDDRPDRRKIYPDFFEGDTTDTEQPWDVETVLNVTIKEEN